MRANLIVLMSIAASCCLLLAPAYAQSGGIPVITDAELAEALSLAGANRGELETALTHFSGSELGEPAMRFLIANSPLADLGSVSADYLIENVTLAIQAREEFSFAAEVDLATWAHYVLPMRVSQEPLEPWRRYYFDKLYELVKDVDTLEEAQALATGNAGDVAYRLTQRRDQGPLTTLKGGCGRCEEIMTIRIDACRAIGVPARNAYCPYWSWVDSNHAWPEAYRSDGSWDCLDGGWVLDACKRAPVVVSICFGLPSQLGPEVLSYKSDIGARYCQINSLPFYRKTCTLNFVLADAADLGDVSVSLAQDEQEYYVWLYVFNFGAMRSVAKLRLDDAFACEVEFGPGKYYATTNAPVANPVVMIDVEPETDLVIDWAAASAPPDDFILEFPRD